MSDSRMIPLDELNKIIDSKIKEYESGNDGFIGEEHFKAKIEALNDLKIEINEPAPIVDTSENIQQTKNVIDTQNIINNDL